MDVDDVILNEAGCFTREAEKKEAVHGSRCEREKRKKEKKDQQRVVTCGFCLRQITNVRQHRLVTKVGRGVAVAGCTSDDHCQLEVHVNS